MEGNPNRAEAEQLLGIVLSIWVEMICDEEPKPRWVKDLAGLVGEGVVDEGVDFGVGEEGSNVLNVEHLAMKLVGLGVDKDELVGEVLGEIDDVTSPNDGDLGVTLGRGRRGGALEWQRGREIICLIILFGNRWTVNMQRCLYYY